MLTSPQDDRRRMVERQLKARGIGNPHVLAAMGEVPRERFVPDNLHEFAYEDGPLPIGEQCDGGDLQGRSCGDMPGFARGMLACTPDCRYDTSACMP